LLVRAYLKHVGVGASSATKEFLLVMEIAMNTLRFVVLCAAAIALTAPALARSPSKADRTAASRTAKQPTPPMRPRAPIRSGTDQDFRAGRDHASSPFAPGGY
jgi:hypothetical protein